MTYWLIAEGIAGGGAAAATAFDAEDAIEQARAMFRLGAEKVTIKTNLGETVSLEELERAVRSAKSGNDA